MYMLGEGTTRYSIKVRKGHRNVWWQLAQITDHQDYLEIKNSGEVPDWVVWNGAEEAALGVLTIRRRECCSRQFLVTAQAKRKL